MKKISPREQILRNYHYTEEIKRLIALQRDDNQRLLLIKYLLYYHSNHVTGRYSDEWIEQQIIQLADRHIQYNPREHVKDYGILHVMTAAAVIGGHTALVNNWISFDTSRRYSIVFTEMKPNDVPIFLRQAVQKSGGSIYYLHGRDDYRKAEELLRLSEHFEKIILDIHMYDMVPLMAYSRKQWKIPVYFYNHANFLFSIGVSVADCYLTLCTYDAAKARRFRGAHNVHVLKMPQKVIHMNEDEMTEDKEEIKRSLCARYCFPENSKIILSMGDDFKYKKIDRYDFADFARRLIGRLPEDVYFFLIGPNPEKARWKKLEKDTGGRVRALGPQLRDEVSRWMKCADAYITSFPMASAGRYEANKYRVKSFTLRTINRICGFGGFPIYDDEGQLIQAVCSHMSGLEQYVHNDWTKGEYEYNKNAWNGKVDKVFGQPLRHQTVPFESRLVISDEELINVQLIETKYIFEDKDKINFVNRMWINILNKLKV